jgi:hypothetical protein
MGCSSSKSTRVADPGSGPSKFSGHAVSDEDPQHLCCQEKTSPPQYSKSAQGSLKYVVEANEHGQQQGGSTDNFAFIVDDCTVAQASSTSSSPGQATEPQSLSSPAVVGGAHVPLGKDAITCAVDDVLGRIVQGLTQTNSSNQTSQKD